MKSRLTIAGSTIVAVAVVCELLLIVGSWIGSALFPESDIISLLSSTGIRWYIGSYADAVALPAMVWILLSGIAYGIVKDSGLVAAFRKWRGKQSLDYVERIALQASAVVCILLTIAILVLTFAPHAILLSASGTIFHSSFSAGFIPMLAFICSAVGITYGLCSSSMRNASSVFTAMVGGVSAVVPLVIVFLFVAHLVLAFQYVF